MSLSLDPLVPYDWQEEDINWLAEGNKLLANDCGLGKTLTAIESAKKYAMGPILVVCPRLTKLWWAFNIERQQAGLVGTCGRAGRGVKWDKIARRKTTHPLIWTIVHPAAVRLSWKDIVKVKWDTIIVDEAHRFKNRQAQQTRALNKIQARRKILMTATPYGRSPADMWALLNYIQPDTFSSYWRFDRNYVNRYWGPPRPMNQQRMAREIAPFYRKRDISILNLPPLTYSDIPVQLKPAQEKVYRELATQDYAEFATEEVVIMNALVQFLRLQQCALDPGLMLKKEDAPLYPLGEIPAKVDWLVEWLQDHEGEPVVLTSRYRKFVEKWLMPLAPKSTVVGGMTEDDVKLAMEEFERTGVLVGSLDAIKEGLNLQRANTIIVMDGSRSSTAEYQLSKRVYRVGQTKPTQIIHLVGQLSYRHMWTVDMIMRKAVTQQFDDAKTIDSYIQHIQELNR